MRIARIPLRRVGPFSIPELLVAGFILFVLASSATPRLGRASQDIAGAALAGNLAVLRNGLDLYADDHNGQFPTLAQFESQLTFYTDSDGNSSPNPSAAHALGPYLRKIPVLTVGPRGFKGSAAILDATKHPSGALPGGWSYNSITGEIRPNLPSNLADASGTPYNTY